VQFAAESLEQAEEMALANFGQHEDFMIHEVHEVTPEEFESMFQGLAEALPTELN
jgi:hypothetical protein